MNELPKRFERTISNLLLGLLLLGLLTTSGCVERTLTIRTEPPGAQVFVDGENVGPSPVDVPFIHYGTREVEARLPSHRTRTEYVAVSPPWWQVAPFDFFSEHLDPRDHHLEYEIFLRLEPIQIEELDLELLTRRADQLRTLSIDAPSFDSPIPEKPPTEETQPSPEAESNSTPTDESQ